MLQLWKQSSCASAVPIMGSALRLLRKTSHCAHDREDNSIMVWYELSIFGQGHLESTQNLPPYIRGRAITCIWVPIYLSLRAIMVFFGYCVLLWCLHLQMRAVICKWAIYFLINEPVYKILNETVYILIIILYMSTVTLILKQTAPHNLCADVNIDARCELY